MQRQTVVRWVPQCLVDVTALLPLFFLNGNLLYLRSREQFMLHSFTFYLCVLYSTSIKHSLQTGNKYAQQLHSRAIAFNSFAPIMLLFTLLFHLLTMQTVTSYSVRGMM